MGQKGIKLESESIFNLNTQSYNGINKKITLGEVFIEYRDLHLSTLSASSKAVKSRRCSNFIKDLEAIKMIDMTPKIISEYIIYKKDKHIQGTSKKYNFDKQIKDLKSIFNWYMDNIDFRFANPIKKHHLKLGVIEEIPDKERQISEDEVKKFFQCLPNFYKDLAITQYFCAGRIGEIAGIKLKNIDLENRILTIKDIIVWIKGAPHSKNCPKNGSARFVYINDTLLEIFKRRIEGKTNPESYIFESRGKPLRYNAINENYNKGWRRADLSHKFSGTHQLRYAAAQIARKKTGNLDMAKAVTGHKSSRMAEKYSHFIDTKMNETAQIELESIFKEAA